MAQKRPTPKPTRRSSDSRLRRLVRHPQFLPFAILTLVVLVALVAVGISQSRPKPFAGAREAADAFMQAYVDCDFQTAKKYYVAFQTNPDQAAVYKQQCVKGQATYSYAKDGSSTVGTKDGRQTKNISYIYNFSQQNNYRGQLVVLVERMGGSQGWSVYSVTPINLTPTNGS